MTETADTVVIPTTRNGATLPRRYDRHAVLAWIYAHNQPGDLVPLDDAVRIDWDTEWVWLRFLACDRNGDDMIDRAHNTVVLTEWVGGMWHTPPPGPVDLAYEPPPNTGARA